MKKTLFLMLVLILSLGMLCACNDSTGGTSGDEDPPKKAPTEGLAYELNADGTGYVLTDIGTATDTAIVIPAEHEGKPVVKIAQSAFENNVNIVSVEGGENLIAIGDWAFRGCKTLSSIAFPPSVNNYGAFIFTGCTSLRQATIPAGAIQYIPKENLADLTINGGDSIAKDAFLNCTTLEKLEIKGDLKRIESAAFGSCPNLALVEISANLESIGPAAFSGCTKLSSLVFANGGTVEKIDSYAFKDCASLSSITLPDSVGSFGYQVFYRTGYYNNDKNWDSNVLYVGKHLVAANEQVPSNYTVKDGTVSIAEKAFYDCRASLVSITVPKSVKSVGASAFEGCTRLATVNFSAEAQHIGKNAFYNTGYYNNAANWTNGVLYAGNCLIEAQRTLAGTCKVKAGTALIADNAFFERKGLTAVELPKGLKYIGERAFESCNKLATCSIPSSVTEIGAHAFQGTSITTVTIPHGVAVIRNSTFQGCNYLLYADIPASVTLIEEYAFGGCHNLSKLTYKGTKEQWKEKVVTSGYWLSPSNGRVTVAYSN